MREPEHQDIVKHKTYDVSGVVIAKYPIGDEQYIDVREDDRRIYWETLAKNWEVIIEYKGEIE